MPVAGTHAGQRIYSPLVLGVYDLWVLGISCRWIWRCAAPVVRERYDRFVRDVHLDVGVGTGYFLDRCRFPSAAPEITLFDLNPHSLAFSARRIARYGPRVVQGDVLQPIPLELAHFGSIAMNFLLHCLPADAPGGKWRAIDHVAPLLRGDGVLFGATALGGGIERTWAQRSLMSLYQRKGIFGNRADTPEALEEALHRRFEEVRMEVRGVIALFDARRPI